MFNRFVSFGFLFLALAIGAVAQSPNTLRQRCPNTSVYSVVKITGVGDINILPCVTKTITYGNGTATISNEVAVNTYNVQKTNTAAGTTGAQTINKPAGTVNMAAGQAAIVITNNTVTTASLPFVTLRTADATCTFVKSAVPTANTLTITLNATCTAETSIAFFVLN